MTQTPATTATPATITESGYVMQGGYRVTVQRADCTNCGARIERVKPARAGVVTTWGHGATARRVCLLPANTTLVATPR